MINSTEKDVLNLFKKVHGEMTLSCSAEVVYDDESNVVGVACMKDNHEMWRSTLVELLFDLCVINEKIKLGNNYESF